MMERTQQEEEEFEQMRKRVMKRVKQTRKEAREGKLEVEMKIRELKHIFGFVKTYSDHSFHIPIRKSKCSRFLEDEESLLPPKQPIFVGAYKERYVSSSSQKKEYLVAVVSYNARAVVIGPKGTPYHDGLFFFDLEFDPYGLLSIRYYCSHSLDQIHPYIYRNGKFLSTWPLRNVEVETIPGATHICMVLHVLQLIQAEYLNEEPYYAKFDDSYDETDASLHHDVKSSLGYNELIFLTNCKTMLFLLSKPPLYFEDFVAEHFRERSEAILNACKAYINGTTHVGHGGSSSSTHIDHHPVSESFKLSLKQLYPKLMNAFEKNNNNIESSLSSSSSFGKKFKIDYFLLMGHTIYYFGLIVVLPYIQPNVNRLLDMILSYIQPYFERLFIRILDFFSLN